MSTRKTWIWIVVGAVVLCVVALIAVAGAGVYFVTRHIQTERSTSADAMRAFESVRVNFRNTRPLYELDNDEQPRASRSLAEMATSSVKPNALAVLAWDPDEERLVRLSLPFWILKLGRHNNIDINRDRGFDLEHLQLNVGELERVGPALIGDFRNREGVRVLVWTQ